MFGYDRPLRWPRVTLPPTAPQTWPWPERREADIREDQTRRIVAAMRARHSPVINATADAIEREFGTYEPGSD